MITTQHTQEALCRAFVIALAARAGANYEIHRGFDYGIDCTLRLVEYNSTRARYIESGFSMDIQLKSTTRWKFNKNNEIIYDLDIKTWNDLVDRDPAAIPMYLAVLCLPKDDENWVTANENRLILRNCCYFLKPAPGPILAGSSTHRISIPRQNLLTSDRIQQILQQIRSEAKGVIA